MLHLAVVGHTGVGKTRLLRSLRPEHRDGDGAGFVPSAGVELLQHTLRAGSDRPVAVQLFDTPGEDRWRALCDGYVAQAHGLVVTLEVAGAELHGPSWRTAQSWLQHSLPTLLLAVRAPRRPDMEPVPAPDLAAIAAEKGLLYREVHPDGGAGLEEALLALTAAVGSGASPAASRGSPNDESVDSAAVQRLLAGIGGELDDSTDNVADNSADESNAASEREAARLSCDDVGLVDAVMHELGFGNARLPPSLSVGDFGRALKAAGRPLSDDESIAAFLTLKGTAGKADTTAALQWISSQPQTTATPGWSRLRTRPQGPPPQSTGPPRVEAWAQEPPPARSPRGSSAVEQQEKLLEQIEKDPDNMELLTKLQDLHRTLSEELRADSPSPRRKKKSPRPTKSKSPRGGGSSDQAGAEATAALDALIASEDQLRGLIHTAKQLEEGAGGTPDGSARGPSLESLEATRRQLAQESPMMRRGKDARSPPSRQKRSLFSRSSSRAKDSPRKDSSLNPNSPLQMQGMMSHALSTPDPHRGVSSSPRSPTRAPSGFGSSSSTGRSPEAERHAELVERARDASNAGSLPLSDLKDDVTANGHFVDSALCST